MEPGGNNFIVALQMSMSSLTPPLTGAGLLRGMEVIKARLWPASINKIF